MFFHILQKCMFIDELLCENDTYLHSIILFSKHRWADKIWRNPYHFLYNFEWGRLRLTFNINLSYWVIHVWRYKWIAFSGEITNKQGYNFVVVTIWQIRRPTRIDTGGQTDVFSPVRLLSKTLCWTASCLYIWRLQVRLLLISVYNQSRL